MGAELIARGTLPDSRCAGAEGERTALLLEEEIEAYLDLIDEGRAEPTAPPNLTRANAECLGGSIFNEVRAMARRRGPMPPEEETVPKLMYAAVLPYLGAAAAAEELGALPPRRAGG